MRTFPCQSHPRAQRGAAKSHSRSVHNPHFSTMSPVTLVSITAVALLILTAPGCQSAPADVFEVKTDQRQLLSQINAVCSSYLSAEVKFWASDPLGELCILMLVQKSKELKTRESKRHLIQWISIDSENQNQQHIQQLSQNAELQGPGGIQSRGYFLYRPRNGRRSLEYD